MFLVEAIKVLSGIFQVVDQAKTTEEAVKGVGNEIKRLGKTVGGLSYDGSMVKFMKKFTIEPIAIVGEDLKYEANIDKILNMHANIFASYFSQVFQILTSINRYHYNVAIDLMGTRTLSGRLAGMVLEDSGRDFVREVLGDNKTFLSFGHESEGAGSDSMRAKSNVGRIVNITTKSAGADGDLVSMIEKDLSVDISMTTSIGDDKSGKQMSMTIRLPIIMKLSVVYVSDDALGRLMAPGSVDKTFKERLESYRAGAIGLMDLVFASDLIQEYKQNRLKGDNELNTIINDRKLSSATKAVQYGMYGFEKYYNMVIISNNTQAFIESRSKGKLTNNKTKDIVLNSLAALSITNVDVDEERVNLFVKDISTPNSLTFKSLSKKSGKSDDLTEILKALVVGRPPIL